MSQQNSKYSIFIIALNLVFIFLISIILTSCKNTLSSSTEIVFPASNVSYSKQVQLLFYQKCNFSGCHDDAAAANGAVVSFTTYTNTVFSVPGMVVPGNSKQSLLVEWVNGTFQPIMPPPPSSQLTPNQIQGLKTWIDEGAKNN